jgi:demethylsterigmatocystin 6-O-methyltransferase
MTVQRAGLSDWLSVFPVEKEIGSWSATPEKAVFVDVGGGYGHQCKAFKAKYPDLPGRIILQDLPQTLERVQPIPGVEAIAQNFFEPQVIEGTTLPVSLLHA